MANYWVVRADRDIQELVEARSLIGIGWSEVGDLGALSPEDIKGKVRATYRGWSPNAIGASAGQLRRFAHEIEVGDIALTPIKSTRQALIGKVTGPYRHNPAAETECLANTRSVEWIRTDVLRDDLSTELRLSLGGLMTVFSVNDHADEIEQVIEGETESDSTYQVQDDYDDAPSTAEEESDVEYFDAVEAYARGRVLKRLYNFGGHEFEGVVGDVLKAMGFAVQGHGRGPDKGIDLVATPDPLGFGEPRLKVQVKRQRGTMGRPEVQRLAGTLRSGEKGLFVSLGGFTAEARGESSNTMTLIDGDAFVDLLLGCYEKLSPKTRTRLPLKHVYLPVG